MNYWYESTKLVFEKCNSIWKVNLHVGSICQINGNIYKSILKILYLLILLFIYTKIPFKCIESLTVLFKTHF